MGSPSQQQPPHTRADRELPPPPAAAGMARPPDPTAREAPVVAAATARIRLPEQEPRPYRVAEAGGPTAREAPVVAAAARIRPPGQEPRPYRANEGCEAPVAARIRPPGQKPRPYRADEARAPVATMVRPPGPYCPPEGREVREPPAAAVPGREIRDAPAAAVPKSPGSYREVERREAPAPAVLKSPGPYFEVERREAPISTVPMLAEQRQDPYHAPESRPGAYPYYPPDRPVRGRRASPLASCLLAAVFLLLAGAGAAVALFILFRPHPPDISIAAVRLPTFAAGNGTVAFTFEQMATVRNPNRAPLAHFDSSLRVAYAGAEVGSVYIPAGLIGGGHSKYMSASFAVPAFPAATPPALELAAQQQPAAAMVMEVDSLLVVKGKVTVLWVLMHRVQATKLCRVGVSPVDGRVLGFRC